MKTKSLPIVCLLLCALMLLSFIPSAAIAETANVTRYLEINATNFPNGNFREWIIDNLDRSGSKSGGYYMTKTQVEAVRSISCEGMAIGSLKGVEHFINLKELFCGGNGLQELDVSKNTKLTTLYCGKYLDESGEFMKNRLSKLNVSSNTKLTDLDCSGNGLTALNVSKNTKLIYLYCNENKLSSLDVSKCPSLYVLWCDDNQLTKLDVSNNPDLVYVTCSMNSLTSLTLGSLPALEGLDCWANQLSKLDLTKLPLLNCLCCSTNRLYSLDLSKNPKLVTLQCAENRLSSLDLSKNLKLTELSCNLNRLGALDLSKNTKLKYYEFSAQTPTAKEGGVYDGVYRFDLKALVPIDRMARVKLGDGASLSKTTGIVTFDFKKTRIDYQYDPHAPGGELMDVSCKLSYETETKPAISKQPANQSVAIGKTATFKVVASGGALSYQWYYRTSSAGTWKKSSASCGRTAIYKVSATEQRNGYQYKCVIKDLAGKVTSSVVTLKTGNPPSITTQPASKTVAVGKTATFKVAASGTGLKYQWYYRTSSSGNWKASTSTSGKTATYKVTVAAKHNGYQFRCRVKNVFGYVYTKTVTLKTGN